MNIKKVLDKVIEGNKAIFSNLVRSKKIFVDGTIEYDKLFSVVHQNADPCFVLSTGRSGTHLMSKLLSKHKCIDVYHEPKPELVYYSKYAYDYHSSKAKEIRLVFDAARYEMIRDSYLLKKKYIETNNRITFFAPQIKELYPNSKFIHLVRNPYSFIKSGLSRNWYTGQNAHDEGRINFNGDEWKTWTHAQKIAWLWNETNIFIENFKADIDENRIITVKAEQMFTNPSISLTIFEFLGLQPLGLKLIKRTISKPTNVGRGKSVDIQSMMNKINQHLSLADKYNYKKHS